MKGNMSQLGKRTNRRQGSALRFVAALLGALLGSRHLSAIPRCCLNPPLLQQALRLVDFDECVVQRFLKRHRLVAEQLSGILAAATRAFLQTPKFMVCNSTRQNQNRQRVHRSRWFDSRGYVARDRCTTGNTKSIATR